MKHVPVINAGAGPVGLTLSILLSRFGICNLVVEMRGGVSTVPRARGIMSRTMKIWNHFGIVEELDALSLPPQWCRNVQRSSDSRSRSGHSWHGAGTQACESDDRRSRCGSFEFDLHSNYPYTLAAVVAERLRDRRVLLVGDAVHHVSPFGGIGVNAGIHTAHNLA
ncbi:FAD-dependent oxidoreductase [Paraburkholderia sp. GAS334]|uniref:FAD-dependent oxidoreductase n=1 Tax=Paraburkholderia sp. GAS334 TaxID=3035131 RepID=UPI003D195F06